MSDLATRAESATPARHGMQRHTVATLVAGGLTALLAGAVAVVPLPYVRYEPGTTVDLLATVRGEPRIQIEDRRTYPAEGELRMTTITATQPGSGTSLLEAMTAYLDPDEAVKPYDDVYGEDDTEETQDEQTALQMATSQDVAVVAALTQLGVEVPAVLVVGSVAPGLPAEGKLEPRDRFLSIGGRTIRDWDDVVDVVSKATPGKPLEFVVERGGDRHTIDVTPRRVQGRTVVGIERGFDFELPFPVEINLPGDIGGPSAGLFFALSVYDVLTPGSLTGGAIVAGTGTMDADGAVGPIGGIQQKIAGARAAGAELFLVPDANCDEAVTGQAGSMRLAAVTDLAEAESVIKRYAADHDADLPTCEEVLAR